MFTKKQKINYSALIFTIFGILFTTKISMAANYYISPNGVDENNGLSENFPINTFVKAYTLLTPGDNLILLDGTYHQQLNPPLSGSIGAPITFKAKNKGRAIIEMSSDGSAISVYSSTSYTRSYLVFDGLIARGHGEYPAININSADNVTEEQMTNNITVKNTGAFGSVNLTNGMVISLGNNLRDSLFEDIWAYGFGRKALQIFGSFNITVRRAVIRYDYWDGSSYKPNDPRTSFSGYNTMDSIFENIIAIDSAPTPPNRSADRAAFTASGNLTPAIVSGSARNKYLGLLSLNNYGNGIEVNGGSGGPNTDLFFKNLIFWDTQYYGVNIQGNDQGSIFSNITTGSSGASGFRINPSPNYPITNESILNCFSTGNNGYGFYYPETSVDEFMNNTAISNSIGSSIEPMYAPTMTYLVNPQTVQGHERGAKILNRYIDGVLTNDSLWPWPNEDLIKQHMCNVNDLATVGRISENGEGWAPQWCQSGKTLTRYIWEYLGNPCPSEICNNDTTPPAAPTGMSVQ